MDYTNVEYETKQMFVGGGMSESLDEVIARFNPALKELGNTSGGNVKGDLMRIFKGGNLNGNVNGNVNAPVNGNLNGNVNRNISGNVNAPSNSPINAPINESLSGGSRKPPNVTLEHKSIENLYIYIRYNASTSPSTTSPFNVNSYSPTITQTVNQYVIMFLRHMNFIIAARTTVNYHLIDDKQLFIKLPVYVYTNDEAALKPLDLVLKRVNAIKSFIENYDFSKDTKSTLWLLRTLVSIGINFNTDFNITVDCESLEYRKIDETLTFNLPKIEYPRVSRKKLSDGSLVTIYEDPYFNDYGVFANLSVPFDEMGMCYNGLHVYEHMMTKGWTELSVNDQICANGVTYPNGICMVYNILNTNSAFLEYAYTTLEWFFRCREEGFWQSKISDDMLMETCRTISETRSERTLASMGRSDLHAYTNNYDRKIFEYWSNKPFEFLLTCPLGSDIIDFVQIESMIKKYPIRPVKRPENVKLKYYPFEVMLTKTFNKTCILKTSINHIKKAIMKPRLKTKVFFGVDCYMIQNGTDDDDLSVFNSVLMPLLFINRSFSDEELKLFIKSHISACNSASMSSQSLCIRHAIDGMDEYSLNL